MRLLDPQGRILLGTDTIAANALPAQEMQALTQAKEKQWQQSLALPGYFAFPLVSWFCTTG